MEKTLTWGECVDYTFLTRDTWRNGGGRRSAETYTNYFTRLKGRSFPISEIRPALVTQCTLELEEEGKVNGTINRFISAISTVLNHCYTEEFIDIKPPSFKRRKEFESIRMYYTKEQVDEIEKVAREEFRLDHLGDIVRAAAYTGMRQGELLKLKVRDIDLHLNVIHVGGRPDVQTKAGNYRSIPIHTHLLPVLKKRMEYLEGRVRIFGDAWTDRYQLQRQFRNVTQRYLKYGDGYVFHSLRHSFATWHVQAGTPFRVLMDLMGHKNMVTTLIYGKSTDKGRSTAMEGI
jgi:integrase